MLACDLLGKDGQKISVFIVVGVYLAGRVLRLGLNDRLAVADRLSLFQSLLGFEHKGFTSRHMIVGCRQKSGLHVKHVLNFDHSDFGAFEIGQVAFDRRLRINSSLVDQFRYNDAGVGLGRGLQQLIITGGLLASLYATYRIVKRYTLSEKFSLKLYGLPYGFLLASGLLFLFAL